MADVLTTPQDGASLHFLKELPAWVVIMVFVAAFLVSWFLSHADFIPRIIDGLIGALLLSLQRKPTNQNSATTDSGDVNVALPNLDKIKEK